MKVGLLLLAVASLFVAGCSTTHLDDDYREFFYGGWKDPKARDNSLQERRLPAN